MAPLQTKLERLLNERASDETPFGPNSRCWRTVAAGPGRAGTRARAWAGPLRVAAAAPAQPPTIVSSGGRCVCELVARTGSLETDDSGTGCGVTRSDRDAG